MANEFLQIEENIVEAIKTIYDPEIPVNIYDLGLIYKIEVLADSQVEVEMTLTAPACPAADYILEEVHNKVGEVDGVEGVVVKLVFDPAWDKEMMSEEAKLELGML